MDVTVEGKPVKAVAQVTKQAFTFVFDRVTGKPIWPIITLVDWFTIGWPCRP